MLCVTVTNRKKPDSHRVRAEQWRNCELSGLITRSLTKGVNEGVRKNTGRFKKRPNDEFSILVQNKDSLHGPLYSLGYADWNQVPGYICFFRWDPASATLGYKMAGPSACSHALGNRTGLSQNLKSWEGDPGVSLATIPSVLQLQESRHPCLKQHSLWGRNVDILFPLLRRVLLSAPETLHNLSEVIWSPVDNS